MRPTSGQGKSFPEPKEMNSSVNVTSVPAGYQLVFEESFNSGNLNTNAWFPYRLPHWSDQSHIAGAQASFSIQNGILTLTTAGKSAWSPWDGGNVFSTLMSGNFSGPAGSKIGLHEFSVCMSNPNCVVFEGQANLNEPLNIYKYGYFELRAKFPSSSRGTWWMVGFEDVSEKSAEIDIIELNHTKSADFNYKCVHFGVHGWDDPLIGREGFFFGEDCSYFSLWHTYGLLWTPGHLALYIDGVLISEIDQSPDYEMVTILDVGRWEQEPANSLEIDYFRVYQNQQISGIIAEMQNGEPGWGHIAAHAVDGDFDTYAQSMTENWDLYLDLGRTFLVTEIVLYPDGMNWPKDMTVFASNADRAWTSILQVTDLTPTTHWFQLPIPISTQYLMFDITDEGGYGPENFPHAIREIEIYGFEHATDIFLPVIINR